MSVTQALLDPMLATGAPRPLFTHYDDATGARVELSRATVANWAAKTANWLVDELDVEPGMPVAVALPAHWQTAGILLGAWWCGAHVTADPGGAEVALVPADEVSAGEGAATVAAVSLDPMGAPARSLPGGDVLDYVTEVRVHGDDFLALTPVPGSTPALAGRTVDDLLTDAGDRATGPGIDAGARVLSTVDWTVPDGVIDGFLTILHARGSLVHCSNADPNKLAERAEKERTTVTLPS